MQPPKAYAGPAVPVRLRLVALHAAWCKARRGKRPSANHLAFASRWLHGLQTLHQQLRAGTWLPRRTVSFVVRHPKTREIHAPDFSDRVVHHWLVPQLEALYEPVFIHDSYANRAGKGSHAAVDRLHGFMRQRNGQGWFLQLDVHNFFNSIHRPTLYALLKHRLGKAQQRGQLVPAHAAALQSLCHKLLAPDAADLRQWHAQIAQFLHARLRLRLKDEHRLAPLAQGVDFLGYVLYPSHRLVRRRVVAHCKGKRSAWAQRHVSGNAGVLRIRATPEALAHLQHLLASYWGHFAHARSVRLRHALVQRFGWLRALFHINPAGDLSPRWVLSGTTLAEHVAWLRKQWPHAVCSVQKGCETLRFAPLQMPDGSSVHAVQTGWLRHGTRRREITLFQVPMEIST